MLVLLRYTNFEQLCETLNFIAPNPDAVGMLEGMLLKFVLPFTDPSLFVPNPIGHYLDF
jgi:hypothetical protein